MKEFKLIVAGGRDFNDYLRLEKVLLVLGNETYHDKEVSIVSGMARGADALGCQFARNHHVELYKMPADWNQYGKRAGFIRNQDMGNFADGLLAFWDGQSKGTAHMIDYMQRVLQKPVHIELYASNGDPSNRNF